MRTNERLTDGHLVDLGAERASTTFAYRLNSENKVKATAVPLHASDQAELAWLLRRSDVQRATDE